MLALHSLVVCCMAPRRDCWSVAFGNSHSDDERCVVAGYDNGDVKMFDLRMNKVRDLSDECKGQDTSRAGFCGWSRRDWQHQEP